MKFAYYPGCSSTGTSADYEKSSQVVCEALGVELKEVKGWNCCGSTPAHAMATELSAALCVRNLDLAAKNAPDDDIKLLTTCPSCLSNLRHAAHRMENTEFKQKVDDLLDEPSAAKLPEAVSLMQVLWDTFKAEGLNRRAIKPLKGIKIVAYYGCLMSRPAHIMNFGDPENPTMMESILEACGATVMPFPLKVDCCGASFGIPDRPMTALLSGRILELAHNLEADAIIVACPLCQMNLDLRQKQASKAMHKHFDMPILYFTQMMGLAFGYSPSALGFDKLCASPDKLLSKLELALKAAQNTTSTKTKSSKKGARL